MLKSRKELRITPAYAGKRNGACTHTTIQTDHPRICGEKPVVQALSRFVKGSPPHTRGKGIPPVMGDRDPRITPAYAGKRINLLPDRCLPWDHPRIRGEKLNHFFKKVKHNGSPPHTRGKVFGWRVSITPPRITPAYAGKSNLPNIFDIVRKSVTWDHPRIRGEKFRYRGQKNFY